MPAVPADLLKPLVADQHGGQIVLMPGGVKIDLDESIAEQGVIFTDLKTAQEKHPEIVAKILGEVVKPEEGKFAALAGALSQNGVLLYVPKVCRWNSLCTAFSGDQARLLTFRISWCWWMKALQ